MQKRTRLWAVVLTFIGCEVRNEWRVSVENQSGSGIETISVSRGEQSFLFGFLPDGIRKGYNTAGVLVGKDTPVNLKFEIEVEDGTTIIRNVTLDLPAHPDRTLDFVITDEFNMILK